MELQSQLVELQWMFSGCYSWLLLDKGRARFLPPISKHDNQQAISVMHHLGISLAHRVCTEFVMSVRHFMQAADRPANLIYWRENQGSEIKQ